MTDVLVACAVTENFLAPASAMVHSLLAASGGDPIEIVVLHDERLSSEGRARLEQTVSAGGGKMRYLAVPTSRLAAFPSGRFPPVIWSRALLPELLPEVDKVLYLDADTIVLDSPAALWATELGECRLAAVANPLYSFMDDRAATLGIADSRRYINSGVLLMDLEGMRIDDTPRQLLDYARAHPDNPYPDQDALSAVLHERVVPLHPRWNAQTTLWDLSEKELPFSADEVREARARPAIVHFIGPFKPWHRLCTHPHRRAYFDHLAETTWPQPQMEGRTAVNGVLRHLSPVWVDRWFRFMQMRTPRPSGAGRRRQ